MRLTAFTDYALRVLIYLAAEPGRRSTIADICAAYDVKANHLTKVVSHLSRHGWIKTVRGKGGGLTLAMPADEICIGQVVRQTERAIPAACFESGTDGCAIAGCCRLQGVLSEAVAAFHAVLDRYTLADLTRNRKTLAGILFTVEPALGRAGRAAPHDAS